MQDEDRLKSQLHGWRLKAATLNVTDEQRNSRMKNSFGITLGHYIGIWRSQGKCCAICKTKFELSTSDKKMDLVVDHNHQTNESRGLLCYKCNTAIGLLMDDPEIINSANRYLLGSNRPAMFKVLRSRVGFWHRTFPHAGRMTQQFLDSVGFKPSRK